MVKSGAKLNVIQGCAHLMKTAVELAFYSGTLAFLCTWLDLSRGSSPVSEGSLAFLQTSASVLVFTSWFLYFLDGKVTSWEYTTMFMSLVRKLIGLFRTFSALFIGFFLAFGILWKSYGHQNNQGVNLVKVLYYVFECPASPNYPKKGGKFKKSVTHFRCSS